jgi:4-hydroxyphenylacetate 3-monooxygenase
MRTGAEYREALRDGRKVWIMGEGAVADVTTHAATRAMVEEYVTWYDRHFDPAWQDVLLTPPDSGGHRAPVAHLVPRSADDLRRMGRSYARTVLLGAGNITHTPGYGNLIALGIADLVSRRSASADNAAVAERYRDALARSGRFLTFSAGWATIGYRFRLDPAERAATRVVRETDAGLVVSGKVGMHTSLPFAEDVYVGGGGPLTFGNQRATFIVPVAAPGVTVVCRRIAARHANPFIAPLSSRFDELDAQMWLDEVFIPWERVFLTEPPPGSTAPTPIEPGRGEHIASWLFWHQLYCWVAKAEFTLGIALACADAMGLKEHPQTQEYLVDLVEAVQTVQSCITAAELDPSVSHQGYAVPGLLHVAVGSLAMLRARQRVTELLRILPGSSLVVAPADSDLAAPEMAAGLEDSFGGGGYTARQRAALLNLAWDHISSGLDGRESAFELHANGGVTAWRSRLRGGFGRYDELAHAALGALSVEMPPLDLRAISHVVFEVRRPVSVPSPIPAPPPASESPPRAPESDRR